MRWLRMISHSFVVVAFAVLCVSSGCDSTDLPDELQDALPDDAQEPKPQILAVDGIADQLTRVGDEIRVALRPLFIRKDGGVMFFTGSSVGDKVDATVVEDTLIVKALAQGIDTVVVFAHGADVESSMIKFAIQILCLTELGPDEASYFPWDIGRRWTYGYWEVMGQTVGPDVVTKGTAVWTITHSNVLCTAGYVRIREEFVGTEINDPYHSRDTVDVSWDRNLVARVFGPKLEVDLASPHTSHNVGPITWRRSASDPEVVRFESTFACGFGGCTTITYEVERDEGLKYWKFDFWSRPAPYRLELKRRD